jgi:hypothetical protein
MAMAMAMAMAMDPARTKCLMPRTKFAIASLNPKRVIFAIALIVGGIFLSWQSILLVVTAIADESNPDLALKFAPHNSLALSSKGDLIWTTDPEKAGDPIIADLGRRALRAQSLNAPALRLLAVHFQMKGDTKKADELIGLATKVTRRDTLSQLWLAQQASERGDSKSVMYHYNIALRTNSNIQAFLFPQITKLLEDQNYQSAFAPYLSQSTLWLPGFLNFAIWNSDQYPALASTILSSGGLPTNDIQYRTYETQIISKLITGQQYPLAQRFYLSLKGASSATFKTVALNAGTTDPKFAPINWRFDTGSGISAKAVERNGRFEIVATASTANSGVVAQKMLFLDAGNYTLAQHVNVRSLGKGASASWMIRCIDVGNSRIILQEQINKKMNIKNLITKFQVPADCNNQSIELVLVGGDDTDGVDLSTSRLISSPSEL